MTSEWIDAEIKDAGTPAAEGRNPTQRVSVPEYLDWHMILDYELDQLSQPETGVIGPVGFTGAGAAIGLVGQFAAVVAKVRASPLVPVEATDLVSVCAFAASCNTVHLGQNCVHLSFMAGLNTLKIWLFGKFW